MRFLLVLLFSIIVVVGGASADVLVFSDKNIVMSVPDSFQHQPPRDEHDLYVGQDGDTSIFLSFYPGGNLPIDDPGFVQNIRGLLISSGCELQDSYYVDIAGRRFLATRYTKPVDQTDGMAYIIVADGRVLLFNYAGKNLGDAVVPKSAAVIGTFRFTQEPVIPLSQATKNNHSSLIAFVVFFFLFLIILTYAVFYVARDSVREILQRLPFLAWDHA